VLLFPNPQFKSHDVDEPPPPATRAQVEQGSLKLDSVTTEQLIGKFGVTETGKLTLKLTTSKSGWERGGAFAQQVHECPYKLNAAVSCSLKGAWFQPLNPIK
jgi:hypothetical protein